MFRVRAFFQRHPLVREALWWAVPALVLGAALRLLMLSYLPYAYWGSDSRSYYSFTHMLLSDGYVSLDEKRRYLYPIFTLPISILPGAPLKWLAWVQHGMGLLAVVPLAYVVRKTLRFWKWWIVPVTALYAGLPMFLWYEHELLGEALFFSALMWTFGGWMAWVTQADPARARRLFWWFFTPLAIFLLTKPSGRFVLPGIVCGLAMVRAWRVLDWRRWVALVVLGAATLTVGSKKQAAWLLYVASFPLTQLDTPQHAEYKKELRPIVEPYIRDIDAYYELDREKKPPHGSPFLFLESPSEENAPPLWAALDKDPQKKRALYMSLALEGIKARPLDFFRIGLQRLAASANWGEFKLDRLESGYFSERLKDDYEGAQKALAKGGKPESMSVVRALGLPKQGPLPPYEEFAPRLAPAPGGWAERTLLAWSKAVHSIKVVERPKPLKNAPAEAWAWRHFRVTVFGYWLLAGLALGVIFYWKTLGVWVVVAMGYLLAVFAVSLEHHRYFAPAWMIFMPVLAVPLDRLGAVIWRRHA